MEKVVKILKDVRLLAIAGLALVAIVLLISLNITKAEPFEIQDKCGILINLESHTIENEDSCNSRCRTQCVSKDLDFRKTEFTKAELGCNTCVCYCK